MALSRTGASYLSFWIFFGKSHLFSHHPPLFFSPWIWPLHILVKWDLPLEALLPFSTMSIISIMGLSCRTFPHPQLQPKSGALRQGQNQINFCFVIWGQWMEFSLLFLPTAHLTFPTQSEMCFLPHYDGIGDCWGFSHPFPSWNNTSVIKYSILSIECILHLLEGWRVDMEGKTWSCTLCFPPFFSFILLIPLFLLQHRNYYFDYKIDEEAVGKQLPSLDGSLILPAQIIWSDTSNLIIWALVSSLKRWGFNRITSKSLLTPESMSLWFEL